MQATADADASKQSKADAAKAAGELGAADAQPAKDLSKESEPTLRTSQQFSPEVDAELEDMLEQLEGMECALSDKDEHLIHLEVQKAHWEEEAHRLQSALESSFAASGEPSPRRLLICCRMCICQPGTVIYQFRCCPRI